MADQLKRSDILNQLRNLMKANKLDGYLIPSSDEFNNEYVPNWAKRLEWISGFSGSNGLMVVTLERCVIYTDGRYLIQAKHEVPTDIDVQDIALLDLRGFNFSACGIDPFLFSQSVLKTYGDVPIISIKNNLVDLLWLEKPIVSTGKYYQFDYEFADRLKLVLTRISPKADYLLVSSPDELCWLLGIRGEDIEYTPISLCLGLLSMSGTLLKFINHGELVTCLENIQGVIQYDPKQTSLGIINTIKPNKRLEAQSPIDKLRIRKTEKQIDNIKLAHIQDGIALCKFLYWLENEGLGLSEYQISEELLKFRQQQPDFVSPSFASIIGFNDNGAIIHYKPQKNSKIINNNGLLLIDSGGQYKIGTTDITRVCYFGKINREWIRHYSIVLSALIKLASGIFPQGILGEQLDHIARAVLNDCGLDYPHGTGHGVGYFLSVHEGSLKISKNCKTALVENAILSNEPGIYFTGKYGVRLENLMVSRLNNDSFTFETLSLVPFERDLIDINILTTQQLKWLNDYHRLVYNMISPHLSKEEGNWLASKCSLI